jgi:hypothetical protein
MLFNQVCLREPSAKPINGQLNQVAVAVNLPNSRSGNFYSGTSDAFPALTYRFSRLSTIKQSISFRGELYIPKRRLKFLSW